MAKVDRASILTTHNEPSNLTLVEKIARGRKRHLTREVSLLRKRIATFSKVSRNTVNPVKRATADAEVAVAEQRLKKLATELQILQAGRVN